ncbi:MAG: helix-turn-helix domain-containing protein [Clostridia bacterium]|jgi:excisionase family DNA binding protein|nr:helix-turn-helix domain-containing protein [Clostridia bacterium]MBR3879505.1 helix-turn-helix domain-containing protein [Clostridia bacterium]
MTGTTYKTYDELPMFINVPALSKLFGISQSSCYELMHEKDFPSLRIGSRIVVPRDKLIEWIEARVGQ